MEHDHGGKSQAEQFEKFQETVKVGSREVPVEKISVDKKKVLQVYSYFIRVNFGHSENNTEYFND